MTTTYQWFCSACGNANDASVVQCTACGQPYATGSSVVTAVDARPADEPPEWPSQLQTQPRIAAVSVALLLVVGVFAAAVTWLFRLLSDGDDRFDVYGAIVGSTIGVVATLKRFPWLARSPDD